MRRGTFVTLALALALILGLAIAQPALASVSTKQVSVTIGGKDPARDSEEPSVSADGRYVAFESEAGDLVPGDHTIHGPDVFVHDTWSRTTVRASVDTEGGDPNGRSADPSISADGRYVAFLSFASDLVPGDGNGRDDIFVRDLVAGTTVRASVHVRGGDASGSSYEPSLSADGRYVAFWSYATDLVQDDGNLVSDVFVRDLVAGITVRVSVDSEGGDPDRGSDSSSISADGRYVAFESWASDLTEEEDGNIVDDIFVRDTWTGTTVRASVDTRGRAPNSGSFDPSISADGRYVTFESYASDLVQEDENVWLDIFVRDLVAGSTVRASVDAGGGDPNGHSNAPSISADGRYVAFQSWASNLVPGDGNGYDDVFVRDLMARTTLRASIDNGGQDSNGDSTRPSISADGRYVAFESLARDLVAGPGDRGADVFIARW